MAHWKPHLCYFVPLYVHVRIIVKEPLSSTIMVQSKFHPFFGSLKSHPDPPLAERQTRPPADPLPFEGDFGPLLFIWMADSSSEGNTRAVSSMFRVGRFVQQGVENLVGRCGRSPWTRSPSVAQARQRWPSGTAHHVVQARSSPAPQPSVVCNLLPSHHPFQCGEMVFPFKLESAKHKT